MNSPVITAIKEKLGSTKVLTGPQVRERYYHIWRMNEPLNASSVVLPRTTAEVSEILKICHEHDQPVVIHGGRTNMVGSTETSENEVVISLEKMDAIEEIDEKSRTITLGAGAILENVQRAAREKDLFFPLNFGAKGSAQIGGVISTNAGGMRVVRYGMTRNLVLGLEVVLADGTVVSAMKKLIKDNSAYDIKHLFIGSEGTLGIITKAVLRLVEAPKSRNCAFVAFNDYDQVVRFLKYMDSGLAGTLSAFELIWKDTFVAMTSPPATAKAPLPYDYNYYVLLESLGSDQDRDRMKLQELLEEAVENDQVEDAVLAQTASDLNWFWKMREDVDVVVAQCNHDQHFDISLPIKHIGPFVNEAIVNIRRLPEVEQCFAFGHAADGNIHFIIGKNTQSEDLIHQINEIIYVPLREVGGSVSAEHGIGIHKKAYLPLSRSEAEIQVMKNLKNTLDPKGILNRGKVLDC